MERAELARLLGGTSDGSREGRVVDNAEPAAFMRAFADAAAARGCVFLSNPAWSDPEREEVRKLAASAGHPGDEGWLMIPSGGSGGALKFARHDGWTLAAAVGGFRAHFGLERIDSVGVLPLHHVSGLLSWMRCAITGGTYVPWAWKDLEIGHFPSPPAAGCVSLVATQLQRLIGSDPAVAWLRQFALILVGGGPLWDSLRREAMNLGLPLVPSYGATETAAMVAALAPRAFLDGVSGYGRALPHARIDVIQGCVRVSGKSVFRGYYPHLDLSGAWDSGDRGGFNAEGSLVIEGRSDDLIITGGKKVEPAEVEAALRSSGEFEDVAVIGLPDPEWGEVVVACYPKAGRVPARAAFEAALSPLASFKHPKRYLELSSWPRNSQGKMNRLELRRLALD